MLGQYLRILRVFAIATLLATCLGGNRLEAVTGPPLEVSQLKEYVANRPLETVIKLVKERGIRFVPTQKIKKEIEAAIPSTPKDAPNYTRQLEILWTTLNQHQPKELVIAIAPFCGGVSDQLQNIQVAMERKLNSVGSEQKSFRIFPIKLPKCISTEGEADEVGEDLGVHLVVWGEWVRDRGIDSFTPKIRVIQSSASSKAFRDAARQYSFTYRFEALDPVRAEVAPATSVAASDLIPLLMGLSFYHEGDYRRAAEVLASVTNPSSDVYIYLAICSLALKDLQTARRYLTNADRTGKASLEALNDVGTLLAQAGGLDEALNDFDKALQVDSHSFKTLNNKAIVLAMKEEKRSEDASADPKKEYCSKDSIETIKQSREFGGPAYFTAIYNHAAILLNCAKYPPTALEGVQILKSEYLSQKSDDDKAWSACGTIYRVELGMYKEAEDCFLEAVRHQPTSEAYWGYLVNTFRVDPDCWRYEGRSAFFSTLASLLPRAHFSGKDRRWREETIFAGLALALVGEGRLREGRETLSKLRVRLGELEECYQQLVYDLAIGRIPTGREGDAEFMQRYLATVFQHFFLVRKVKELDFRPNLLVHEYEELLQGAPSCIPARLGKALLEFTIAYDESSATEEQKASADRTLLQALKESLGATANQEIRTRVRVCIKELTN